MPASVGQRATKSKGLAFLLTTLQNAEAEKETLHESWREDIQGNNTNGQHTHLKGGSQLQSGAH